MAEDFYKKAQVLYDEFQKRELHYLNEEKKWNSMLSKKDFSKPLQEYLQKIDIKEKEVEQTYKNVMKQMEDLDRKTDLMSLKLEKLRIFRNNIRTFDSTYWPSPPVGSNFFPYGASSSDSVINVPSMKQNLQTVSTQTENIIYCAKCHSNLFEMEQHNYFDRINNPTDYLLSEKHNTSAIITLPKTLSSSIVSNVEQNIVEKDKSTNYPSNNLNGNFIVESNSERTPGFGITREVSILPDEKLEKKGSLIVDRSEPLKFSIVSNDDFSKKVENGVAKDGDTSQYLDVTGLSSNSISMLNKDIENTRNDGVENNVEPTKSDEGSMNHEFDFLESETHSKVILNTKMSLSKNSSINKGNKPISSLKIKDQVTKESLNSKLQITVDKSDSSGSVTGSGSIPSDNVSIASDSDSLPEKESPLKASAAYQALLGNKVFQPQSKRKPSDTDSEDEVEKALANVVQKSSQQLQLSSAPPKREEESIQPQFEVKSPVKTSKAAQASNPKSKLSKSTRKVLGLDTSSGSEVDLAIKPKGDKIEEDSDEFDFFD